MRRTKFNKNTASIILTCLGGAGVIVTSVMAVRETPKALNLIEEAENNKGEKLSKWEVVKIAAPAYIPSMACGAATIVCIFGANILSQKQQASLASGYAFIEQSYKQYRQKVIELYGVEAHQKVVDAIAVEDAHEVYPYVISGFGHYSQYLEDDYGEPRLFYDAYGRRYFNAPLEQVLQAEYHLNRIFVTEGGAVCLNDFYTYLGLDPTPEGDEVGWNMYYDDTLWIDFNHRKVTMDDGLECYIIETAYLPTKEALTEEC
ncbi:hypothetical protein DW790_06005 [Firmicutes bacterium AM31-12AC]|nr:hypothetical protein DW790_06005 [Firmicutes bacterium AM31-12AC]